MKAGVIDYGLGNLPSVTKALERVGATATIVERPAQLDDVDAVVLPGVGHFGAGARNLDDLEFSDPLREWAKAGKPFLAICIGLQLLFERSDEDPDARGLGIVDGRVRRLDAPKVPHIGWNTVEDRRGLVAELASDDMVYFVHSFYADADPRATAGTTEYGRRFCSVIEQDNVVGFQFHPEKSAAVGQRLLKKFCGV